LKVASHAIGREGILNSIKAGVDSIEHGHYLDNEIIDFMVRNNIAWIPTLYIYKQIAELEGIPNYAQEKAKKITEIHNEAFVSFFNSGVLIGAGSDAGSCFAPHPSVIEELQIMNKYCPNNVKTILKTATSNAGKILALNVGQITEGYQADFIHLANNPIEDINALNDIRVVYKDGEKVSF
jgi:imidazolonepropionase-like amidohydrolase